MMKLKTMKGYDLYVGIDKNGKPLFNVIKEGGEIPTTGYFKKEYLEKIKGVSFSVEDD